eukprot:scaffold219017_cov35-Tisochrysis_lutea.AAC.3
MNRLGSRAPKISSAEATNTPPWSNSNVGVRRTKSRYAGTPSPASNLTKRTAGFILAAASRCSSIHEHASTSATARCTNTASDPSSRLKS